MSIAIGAAVLTLAIGIPQLKGELGSSNLGLGLTMTTAFAILQLLRVLLASVLGLDRRGYRTPTPTDLVPVSDEEPKEREARIAALWYDYMYDLEEAGNQKVGQMAIAHRALKNFVAAVLVGALMVAGAQMTRSFESLRDRGTASTPGPEPESARRQNIPDLPEASTTTEPEVFHSPRGAPVIRDDREHPSTTRTPSSRSEEVPNPPRSAPHLEPVREDRGT